jgi:hypothetical protein
VEAVGYSVETALSSEEAAAEAHLPTRVVSSVRARDQHLDSRRKDGIANVPCLNRDQRGLDIFEEIPKPNRSPL